MKFRFIFMVAITSVVAAQAAKEVPITAEPHHHLVLQNRYVRVFKVEVPSQQSTLMHRHDYDYAYVTIGATELLNRVEGKPEANLKLQDGETRFSPGPFAHLVQDLAPTPFRNVTVEFLPQRPAHKQSQWEEERGLQILQGGTQEILFARNNARASDVQLNPHAALPKAQAVTAELIVAVDEARLRDVSGAGAASPIQLSPGDVRWLQPPRALMNAGQKSTRLVCFEFH